MIEGVPVATVIGDLVGSRRHRDRAVVHERLQEALDEAGRPDGGPDGGADGGADAGVIAPLRITVGDEFQGSFVDLGSALRATRRLLLSLQPDIDVRHGLGWGPVELLRDQPRVEDGPGWWAARAAVEEVSRESARPAHRSRRTAYQHAPGVDGPDPAAVNAALVARDELLGRLSPRSWGVLRGLLDARTQREIADELQITPSAVSQRVRHDGLAALVQVQRLLEEIR